MIFVCFAAPSTRYINDEYAGGEQTWRFVAVLRLGGVGPPYSSIQITDFFFFFKLDHNRYQDCGAGLIFSFSDIIKCNSYRLCWCFRVHLLTNKHKCFLPFSSVKHPRFNLICFVWGFFF